MDTPLKILFAQHEMGGQMQLLVNRSLQAGCCHIFDLTLLRAMGKKMKF